MANRIISVSISLDVIDRYGLTVVTEEPPSY